MRTAKLKARQFVPGSSLAYAVWDIMGTIVRTRIQQDEYDLFIAGKHPLGSLPKPDSQAIWLMSSGGTPLLDTTDGQPVFGDCWQVLDQIHICTGDYADYGFYSVNEVGKGYQFNSRGNRLILRKGDYTGRFPNITMKKVIDGITIVNGTLTVQESISRDPIKEALDYQWTVHHSVAFDALTYGEDTSSGTSLSITHTCAGSDRLILGLCYNNSSSPANVSATYNSAALTHHGQQISEWDGNEYIDGLYKITPSTGSNTLAFTTSLSGQRRGAAYSVTGADQTTGVRTASSATDSGDASAVSNTVTTQSGDYVVDWVYVFEDPGPTVGSGQTQRLNQNFGALEYLCSSEQTASGTSTVMSWSDGSNTFNWMSWAVPIIPSGGGAGRTTKNTRSHPLGYFVGETWRVIR